MRQAIGLCAWGALVAVLAPAQEAARQPAAASGPGKRLRLELVETRQQGESKASSRASTLLVDADARARLFVGSQLAITVSERDVSTTIFKNAGVDVRVKVSSAPDGRYGVELQYEQSQRRQMPGPADAPLTGRNPVIRVVKSESRVTLGEGERVPFATAVDPVTGDVVELELALRAAPAGGASRATAAAGPLRARLVLQRRKGDSVLARRPYSVMLQAGAEGMASVFSGSMLPVQVRMNNQVTVALKDVGAGLKLKAHRLEDGRYRLDVDFSDGVLSPGEDSPRLRVFESESQLVLREGEVVTLASAVDPETGESVEAELTIEGAR